MRLYSKIGIAAIFGTIAIVVGIFAPLKTEGQREPTNQKTSSDERTLTKQLAQFPVAVFDAIPDSSEAVRAARVAVGNRYDGRRRMVMPTSPSEDGSNILYDEPSFRTTLPIKEADAIIVGEVVEARAFLSNDKKNVYSEFRLRVDETIMNRAKEIRPNEFVTVDRIGGKVLYPSGVKWLTHIAGLLMPRLQRRYLLFLGNQGSSENFEIICGYELAHSEIFPLNTRDNIPGIREFNEKSLKEYVSRMK